MEIELFSKKVDDILFKVYYVTDEDESFIKFEQTYLPDKDMFYVEIPLGDGLLIAEHIKQMVHADFDMRQYVENDCGGMGCIVECFTF